ncbi:carbon-monoxide dehydrogenase, catalytic subunit (plasmid) [Azoarcus sp. KH32C]|nr:carbon-monoxide dehydrogenase, catalytic subunit [Azoarcus sp. KH32C]
MLLTLNPNNKVRASMRAYFIDTPMAPICLALIVLIASNAEAHWSGIDLCDDVDGIEYGAAKKILQDKGWSPDIPKHANQVEYSQHPEFSCTRDPSATCEVTFRKGGGFIVLEIKKYPDEFAINKCY